MLGIHVIANFDTLLIRDCRSQEVGKELASLRDVLKRGDFGPIPMLPSAPWATRGLKVEGFRDCEMKEGDEGGFQILGWKQVAIRYQEWGVGGTRCLLFWGANRPEKCKN